MKQLPNIGMILVENNRSRAYLQRMAQNNLLPGHVILLQNITGKPTPGQKAKDLVGDRHPDNDIAGQSGKFVLNESEALSATIQRLNLSTTVLQTTDINGEAVVNALSARPETVWIYSGPGGALVKPHMFKLGKRFLHIHPGVVPEYRGSTTIYYSLLGEGKCGASAIFLSEAIDEGPLLAKKEFAPPQDRTEIDYLYDPMVRSELLIDVLLQYQRDGKFNEHQQPTGGEAYYIMHPVLRHICLLGQ